MSTDTTQGGEDRRLPATWEEFQRARREAWRACAQWVLTQAPLPCLAVTYDQAASRYPITKRVPREVALVSGKGVARVVGGRVSFQAFDGGHYYDAAVSFLAPEDAKAIADLVARPYDEVTE